MKKLAIVTTHPIQYNAPLFRLIAQQGIIQPKVFYTWENSKEKIFDKKFGKEISWDIPLLDGYNYTFVKNTAKVQSSSSFRGIKNPTLINELKEWQPDSILVYGWNFHSHLQVLRYFKGKIPLWFRGDSTLLDEKPGLKTTFRRIILKWVYSHVDKAFYVGTNNKNYYLKHGLKEHQLVFAPHAIDNERFFDKTGEYEKKAKQWRQELGFVDSDVVVLFAGKFEKKKNPLLLIEAAKHFENDTNLKFLLVGNGELETEMKQKAGKNIVFLPFQNQSIMPAVYRLGNIFCLPSISETWGLAVNEAMACGLKIIVSDKVGCAVDLATNSDSFIFIDFETLCDSLQKLVNQKTSNNLPSKLNSEKISEWSFRAIAVSLEQNLKN